MERMYQKLLSHNTFGKYKYRKKSRQLSASPLTKKRYKVFAIFIQNLKLKNTLKYSNELLTRHSGLIFAFSQTWKIFPNYFTCSGLAGIAKNHLPPFPSKQTSTCGYFAKFPPKSQMLVCKVVAFSTTNSAKVSGQLHLPYYGHCSENSLAPFPSKQTSTCGDISWTPPK